MILLLFSSLAFWTANQDASPQTPPGFLPRVVATNPAAGSIVSAGPLTLSVTFDRPMAEGSYSFVRVSADSYPDCEGQPTLLEDLRTYSLSCTVAAGRRYEV